MLNKNYDNLFVVNPKAPCPICGGNRRKRKECEPCKGSGMLPINLSGLWYPSSGFLVCGGPSVNKIDFKKLRERGIVSFGVNNVAGHVPVDAWCFSDPQTKFHHGLFFDPKCITFSPIPKLRKHVRVKLPDNTFRMTDIEVKDCPGTIGFNRKSTFDPETFFSDPYAHWGKGEKGYGCLCTMLLGFRLIHYLGCKKVYLLGVDFWITEQAGYSFNQAKTVRNGRYDSENKMLRDLKVLFDKNDFKVYNCNPDSKCDVFEYVPFDKAVEDCKKLIPNEPFDLSTWYDKGLYEKQLVEFPEILNMEKIAEIKKQGEKNEIRN